MTNLTDLQTRVLLAFPGGAAAEGDNGASWTDVAELATATGLTKKQVQGVLAGLSKQGLIYADEEPANGAKGKLQCLTDEGARMVGTITAAAEAEANDADQALLDSALDGSLMADVTAEMMAEAEEQEAELEAQEQAEAGFDGADIEAQVENMTWDDGQLEGGRAEAEAAAQKFVDELNAAFAAGDQAKAEELLNQPEVEIVEQPAGYATRKAAVAASKLDPKATGDVVKGEDGRWTYTTSERDLADDLRAVFEAVEGGVCAAIRATVKAFPAATKAELVEALKPLGVNPITIGVQRGKALKG